MSSRKYILKKDIVIPAGTVFTERFGKREYGSNCYQSPTFGLTKDTSGDVFYGIEPDDPEMKEWFEEITTHKLMYNDFKSPTRGEHVKLEKGELYANNHNTVF